MQAAALAEGGAEVIWIETMSSTEEVAAAAEAGRATGLPVCATLTFDTARRSMMGITPADYAQFATQIGLDMAGSNCGVGPAELMDSTQGLIATGIDIPIVAKGNCGIPQYVDGAIHFHGSPELMAQYALFARDAGATIIGGCCGTTPEHIAAMVRALRHQRPGGHWIAEAMTAALGRALGGTGGERAEPLTAKKNDEDAAGEAKLALVCSARCSSPSEVGSQAAEQGLDLAWHTSARLARIPMGFEVRA